jgi:hypothetical protein
MLKDKIKKNQLKKTKNKKSVCANLLNLQSMSETWITLYIYKKLQSFISNKTNVKGWK